MNNLIATVEMDETVIGICDQSRVISILPFPGNGQVKASPEKTDEEIEKELNMEVSFLKENPIADDKGMVGLFVNCKGEMVKCRMSNKTQSPILDEQIVAVFSQLKKWSPGKFGRDSVDTYVLYSFTIKEGKIVLN